VAHRYLLWHPQIIQALTLRPDVLRQAVPSAQACLEIVMAHPHCIKTHFQWVFDGDRNCGCIIQMNGITPGTEGTDPPRVFGTFHAPAHPGLHSRRTARLPHCCALPGRARRGPSHLRPRAPCNPARCAGLQICPGRRVLEWVSAKAKAYILII